MDQILMKEKSIWRLVFIMSVPNVLSMLVNSLYNIVDSFFVAQISENAMTALSFVFPIQNLVTSIGVGFGVGINAVIALSLGAKKQKMADCATSLGIFLSFLHGLILTAICILIMPWFLSLFTDNQEIISMGIEYSNMAFLFAVSVNVGIALEKVFQALGKMKTTMVVLIAGCITNIILDPILIFGLGPIPAMGIAGAALATGIGQTLSVKIKTNLIKPERKLIKKLYYIGIPATLNMAFPSLLISALNGILATYSQIYVTILGIYYKLQTFVYLPANGIIQGIRPLISFNYGAKEYHRMKKIYHTALGFSLAIMFLGTILCSLVPEQLMSLFTKNQETINYGIEALQIISIGFMVSTVSITTCGALEALGEGLASLIISALRYIVIIIPIAFCLSKWLGAKGVWHAFWISEVVVCGISYLLYRKFFAVKNREIDQVI